MYVHANLPTIKSWVREDVLHNMDITKQRSYVKCEIVSVSSYVGSAPTFQIIVNKESIFSYVPPHLLFLTEPKWSDTLVPLGLKDLVYHNCKEAEFALFKMDYLVNRILSVFFKTPNLWLKGKYLFTMDWHIGNDLLHCLELENGQIAFLPSHKISLGEKKFQPYLKLIKEWRV